MVEVGQHVGASALQGSAELGQTSRPGGTCGAQGVDDRGHRGLSPAPIRVGLGGDDPLVDAPGRGDRDVAAVGERWSTVIVGGCSVFTAREACPAELVDRWAPGRVMINVYGPTETTMWASKSEPLTAGSRAPPIGSPVAGAAFLSLMGGCGRCRRAWSVSCMWPVPGWAAGIGGGPR